MRITGMGYVETWQSKVAADPGLLITAMQLGLKRLGAELVNFHWLSYGWNRTARGSPPVLYNLFTKLFKLHSFNWLSSVYMLV